jgi:hypothetical protein
MPYADVTKRRTYHAGYMQQWRARQAQQTPSPLPAASALVAAAQQLATAAQALHRQAEDTNSVPMLVQTLRQAARLLVEVTGLLVEVTSGSPSGGPGEHEKSRHD